MATLILYRNDNERIRVSKQLTTLGTITGTFRGNADILHPTVIVQGEFTNQCNYFRIEEFGRYYYVTNPILPRNGLIELHGEVDVLNSWAQEIRRNPAIVERQKTDYNLYLPDSQIHTFQNDLVGTQAFPNGFNTRQYILTVVAV